MISKWIATNPLTIEERRKIKEGIDLDLSYRQLSKHVGRARSTIQREVKHRTPNPWEYDPELAQADFEAKQKLIGIKKVK